MFDENRCLRDSRNRLRFVIFNSQDHGYCREHISRPLYFRIAKWSDVVDACLECQRIKAGSGVSVSVSDYRRKSMGC